jgi:hypothetical protein
VKIKYENKHASSRTFALHSDQPDIVHLPQQRLALSAGASAFVELIFQPQPEGTLHRCDFSPITTLQHACACEALRINGQ